MRPENNNRGCLTECLEANPRPSGASDRPETCLVIQLNVLTHFVFLRFDCSVLPRDEPPPNLLGAP